MKRLAVFASGSGTNFEAIAQACVDGRLDARIALLVCDVPGAKVLERGARFGVEIFCFRPKSYACKADFETEIADRMDALGIDLVCLAGYMRIIGPVLLDRYGGSDVVHAEIVSQTRDIILRSMSTGTLITHCSHSMTTNKPCFLCHLFIVCNKHSSLSS